MTKEKIKMDADTIYLLLFWAWMGLNVASAGFIGCVVGRWLFDR